MSPKSISVVTPSEAGLQAIVNMTSHPYFPAGVEIPGYVANSLPLPMLLSSFFSGIAVIWAATYVLVTRTRPNITRSDLATSLWFGMCGCIHLFFEGYFAYNFHHMGSRTHIFGQLWREYSLSDSRYLTQDSFVTCMETITAAFWGPLSFVCTYFIATNHPLRHPLQIIISLGQLYGDILYYATCTFDNWVKFTSYCRPETFYFFAYYLLCNAFWIVIPLLLIWQSAKETGKAFAKLQALEKGDIKKHI